MKLLKLQRIRFGYLVWILGCFLLALQSCKTHRHLSRSDHKPLERVAKEEGQRLTNRLQLLNQEFDFLQLKGKALLTLQGKDQREVTMQIRLQKDQVIWISVTAFLGTEVARMKITPDQIQIMNRMDATFTDLSFAEFVSKTPVFSQKTPDEVFRILQQLFTAFPVAWSSEWNDADVWKISRNDDVVQLTFDQPTNQGSLRLEQWLDAQSLRTQRVYFSELQGQKLEALYSWGARNASGKRSLLYPEAWTLDFQNEGLSLQCTFQVESVQWPEELGLPYSVPTNYKQVDSLLIQ